MNVLALNISDGKYNYGKFILEDNKVINYKNEEAVQVEKSNSKVKRKLKNIYYGDYFPLCADTAGKISIHQLKLALRLGDPNIAARCRLYLSLSLIQKKKFKFARRIVYNEYHLAKQDSVVDSRLLNMCKGIWSKLQYEYELFRRKNDGLRRQMKKIVI